jgi:hypothetical protein
MKHARRRRLVVFIAALSILALPAGGVAYAYWKGTGTGAGNGIAGTTVALTLSAGTPAASLFPGGQTSLVLTATNSNDFSIHVNSLSLNAGQGTGGFAVDGAHSGCSVAALGFTTQTNGGAGWDVPARVGVVNGTLAVTLTNSLSMTAAAADACQGATFTVYLAAG